jgi:hypothetical protein
MATELEQLTAWGETILADCRTQLATLPLTSFGAAQASGATAAAMRVEAAEVARGYTLKLFAPGSILTLIFGRRAGSFPNLTGIKRWIAVRGIVPHPDRNGKAVSTDSLAYLIGRKIQREGNTVFQENQGQPSKLFADVLGADNLLAGLKTFVVPVLIEDVRTALRETILA